MNDVQKTPMQGVSQTFRWQLQTQNIPRHFMHHCNSKAASSVAQFGVCGVLWLQKYQAQIYMWLRAYMQIKASLEWWERVLYGETAQFVMQEMTSEPVEFLLIAAM